MGRITIAILTVPRKVSYIHQTLASIFSAGRGIYRAAPVHIVIDSNDTRYLSEYNSRESLRLHYLSDAEAAEQDRRGLCARLCYGYCRCFSLPVDRGLLYLEDDVIARPRFLRCLFQAIDEMEGAGLKRYVLSVHSKLNLPVRPRLYRGKFYIRSPASEFYGTQGMYFPADIIPELSDYIHQHGVANYRRPGDLLIREFVQAGQNLYNTVWDLVEHIGSVSTGLGMGRAFVSPTFHEPWRPLERPEIIDSGPSPAKL